MNSPRKLERLLAQALQKETEAQRMTDPIIEAAALALEDCGKWSPYCSEQMARAALAAATPLILANERNEIANQARRYAGHYPEASDGRNTFIMLAEWIEARK